MTPYLWHREHFGFSQGILRRRAPQNDRLPKPMWQTTAVFDAQCASNGNKKEEFILNMFCGNFLGQYLMLLYLARSVSQMAIYSVHQMEIMVVFDAQCASNGNKKSVSNMNLKEKISSDLKNALREKKTVDLSVLRMLQSAIRNKEIEKKKRDGLTDEEIVEVISSEIKKRKEAIEEYTKGQRQDLADKEKSEFEVLMRYMPKQMEEMEIREEVKKAIQEVGAKTQGELGKVMKILMPRMKGKADGALVNKVVREELQKLEELQIREK